MTLEDLVTDALVPESREESASNISAESVLESFHAAVNSGTLLHGGEGTLSRMGSAEGSEFHQQTALLAASFLAFARSEYRQPYSLQEQARSARLVGAELFSRAAEYLHTGEGREDILRFTRQALDNHYLEFFFSDSAEHISYLEGFWGQETAERLARLGGVQKSTARNWMRGSSPASAVHTIKRTVEVLYHLRSSLGIEGDEAREWMDAPLPSGETPFEVICSRATSSWNIRNGNVQHDPLTEQLEKLGILAFSWPALSFNGPR